MKKIARQIALLTLALLLILAQTAVAEPDAAVKGIYDALLAEGSDYSQLKALYTEYFPGIEYAESLADDGFTIEIRNSEYIDGSWTFTRDGDFLTTTIDGEDFGGIALVLYVLDAVGNYYGMDTALLNGYVNGLIALGIDDESFSFADDGENATYRIGIAGPWDMPALDQMVLDETLLDYGPLGEDSTSMTANIGKIMMVANGSADELSILLGEYGGLDDVAYQSIVNVVNILKPQGYEDFTASFTGLKDAEGAGWSVRLNVDADTVAEDIEDAHQDYSYARINFGAQP